MCGGGGFAKIALPIAGALAGGAFLGPALGSSLAGVGGLSTGAASAVGAGLGAGIGSFGGGLVSGASPGDALRGAAISGLTSGVVSGLGGVSGIADSLGLGGDASAASVAADLGGGSAAATAGGAVAPVAGAAGAPIDLTGSFGISDFGLGSPFDTGASGSLFGGAADGASGSLLAGAADALGSGVATGAPLALVPPGAAVPAGMTAAFPPATTIGAAPGVTPALGSTYLTSPPGSLLGGVDITSPSFSSGPGGAPINTGGVTGGSLQDSPGLDALMESLGVPSTNGYLMADPGTLLGGNLDILDTYGISMGGAGGAAPFNYSASGLGKIFNDLGLPQNAVTEYLAKDPMGAAKIGLGGAGLLYNMSQGDNLEGVQELRDQAGQLTAQGQQLQSYLNSGQLPPGAKAALDQATAGAKAAIRSKYASLNQSGSTAERAELNDVDLRAAAQGFGIASSLLQTGVNQSGLASNIYANLLKIDQQQNAATGQAIANFATALGG